MSFPLEHRQTEYLVAKKKGWKIGTFFENY